MDGKRVIFMGFVENCMGTMTEEDVERIKKEFDRLNADPKARKELFTRIGFMTRTAMSQNRSDIW